jgi:hypothetical protein
MFQNHSNQNKNRLNQALNSTGMIEEKKVCCIKATIMRNKDNSSYQCFKTKHGAK